MSIAIHVFLDGSRTIDPKAWAAAIREAGFDVALDEVFDPLEHRGYLPCRYEDRRTGFEYFAGDVAEYREELRDDGEDFADDELRMIGERDLLIELVTHSRYDERAVAVIAAAALAEMLDGVVHDAAGGRFIDAAAALAWARDTEHKLAPEIEQEPPLA